MKLSIFNSSKRSKSSLDRPEESNSLPTGFRSADEPPGIQIVSIQENNTNGSAAEDKINGAANLPYLDARIDALYQIILNRLLLVAVLLGIFVYIFNLPDLLQVSGVSTLHWIVLGLYSLTWILVIVAAVRQRMAYARRAALLFLALYATGLALLLLDGAIGGGQAVLVVIPFFAALILGSRGRNANLILSIGVMILTGLLIAGGLIIPPAPLPWAGAGSLFPWLVALANFTLLAIGGTVSVGLLLDGLQDLLDEQHLRANALEIERDQQAARAENRANDLHRRLVQIRTVAEINRAISRVLDIDRLLPQVCELVRQRFNLYYVGIFLIEQSDQRDTILPDGETNDDLTGPATTTPLTTGERYSTSFEESTPEIAARPLYAVLKAGSGEAGRIMLAEGHRLAVGGDSMIGWATANRQPRIAQKVVQKGDAAPITRFDNPHLPLTRSELALPIQISEKASGEADLSETGQNIRVLGAMTIQSTQERAFDQDDIVILQGIADSLASAIENARLFAATQASLDEIRTLHRQYLEQAWRLETSRRGEIEVSFEDENRPPAESAVILAESAENRLEMPIRLRDQVIGSLTLEPATAEPATRRTWTPEDLALVEAVTNQVALALENARLLEDTRRKVNLEHTAASITSKLWASADVETILRTVLQELGASLGAREGSIELWPPENHPRNGHSSGGPSAAEPTVDWQQAQGEALDASV